MGRLALVAVAVVVVGEEGGRGGICTTAVGDAAVACRKLVRILWMRGSGERSSGVGCEGIGDEGGESR